MTNIKIIPRTRRSLVRVVEQQKGQAYTKPAVASRHGGALGRLPGQIHLDSLTTIIGLSGVVKGCLERFRRIPRGEQMGTGARGAPVPVVGLYVKVKRAQSGSLGSPPNEGHVNSL